MELNELHIQQSGAGVIRQGVAVAGVLPRIAGDLKRPSDAAGGQDDRFRMKQFEAAPFAIVGESSDAAVAILQQRQDGGFHVEIDTLMDAVILKSADHFEAGSIAHVRQTRIAMPSEVALQDLAVLGAVEHGTPGFELVDPVRRFFGVELGHAPVVEILASAHGVGEVDAPVIAIVHVAHRGGHAPFGHDGVGFPEQ